MANCEEEQFSTEEGSTLEELRNKLARLNLRYLVRSQC